MRNVDTCVEKSDLSELIEAARKLPSLTGDEREDHAVDFAYGNLACTTNHKPSRAAFEVTCLARGWSRERFEAWAKGKEWKP